MQVSQKARALILHAEADDGKKIDQPGQWPGEESGITIGIGYDLGYERAHFAGDWGEHLSQDWMTRLSEALGKTGEAAHALAPKFHDIIIPNQAALAVFDERTLPREAATTLAAFPGADFLPEDAAGALVSLIYNRGPKMSGDGRREMRMIRILVVNYKGETRPGGKQGILGDIAKEIRSTKRLWIGKNVDGLLVRRDAEAALVESSIASI